MKKIIVIVLILMNVVSVNASSNIPKYKIVANSNSEKDIKKMYKIKNDLIMIIVIGLKVLMILIRF